MKLERLQEPARIYGDDDDEERQRKDEVHGLEDLDHAFRRAAVEVVDVEHDPVDDREVGVRGRGGACGLRSCSRSSRVAGAQMQRSSQLAREARPPSGLRGVGRFGRLLTRGGAGRRPRCCRLRLEDLRHAHEVRVNA